MDLRINSKSHVPIHVQLEGQIKHLILTSNFEVGSRLPSIRAMAGFLRVNRNTVARVFSDLEREGCGESPRQWRLRGRASCGGGGFEASRFWRGLWISGTAAQVYLSMIWRTRYSRGPARSRRRRRLLFVECTRAELDLFSSELEDQLPVEVERVLLEDLADRVSDAEDLPWRLAVTTFFHIHEVQDMVEPHGIEAVALLAEATLESLQRLMELPSGLRSG